MTSAMTPSRPPRHLQRGASLIEIFVGLTIGLLIIGVAIGAVQVSRQLAGTTSEASRLQQQAAYALRIIGQQVRQAGGIQLNLAFNKDAPPSGFLTIDPADPVAFQITTFDRATQSLATSTERPLQTGYANYQEQLSTDSSNPQTQLRDCLGSMAEGEIVSSAFFLHRGADTDPTGELRCAGSNVDDGEQALVADVADFQVSYLRERLDTGGQPVVDRVDASTASANWAQIYGVEVCIEMMGRERLDTGATTYRPCGWTTAADDKAMGDRLRLVYHSTFQLRSQGAL